MQSQPNHGLWFSVFKAQKHLMSDLVKRLVLRVSDAQLAWVAQMAADEGMDNSTFVRVVIDRLSKNRPPLIGMMASRGVEFRSKPFVVPASFDAAGAISQVELSDAAQQVGDVLAQRAAEAEAAIDEAAPQTSGAEDLSGAIPLRRVPRERFNPGRS